MQRVLSVSELTSIISHLFDEKIGYTAVSGEISNYKLHSSGHRYFTLKDENAQISCTLWRGRPLNFQLADGMKVIAKGSLSVYPPRGQYQLDCIALEPIGQGDLYLAYEALKKKLQDKGYFDTNRKMPLPEFPKSVGVSTSPTGAAIKDIITTIGRRNPLCTIYFRPTLVQGEGSAEDIVAAIEELQNTPAELLIVGRGGGSLEDLWSYNTEIVADAIFQSSIPIISAVGHETDFTIADFVADVRAATPTAAAELVTPITFNQIISNIEQSKELMTDSISNVIDNYKRTIDSYIKSSSYKRVYDKIRIFQQTVDSNSFTLQNDMNKIIKANLNMVNSLESHCKSLQPLSPLRKGFALLEYQNHYLTNRDSLSSIDELTVIREKEKAQIRVLSVE